MFFKRYLISVFTGSNNYTYNNKTKPSKMYLKNFRNTSISKFFIIVIMYVTFYEEVNFEYFAYTL